MTEEDIDREATDAVITQSVAEEFAALCHRSRDLLRLLEWNYGGHPVCPTCEARALRGEKHTPSCAIAGLIEDLDYMLDGRREE